MPFKRHALYLPKGERRGHINLRKLFNWKKAADRSVRPTH
jgi:hypothetical protein